MPANDVWEEWAELIGALLGRDAPRRLVPVSDIDPALASLLVAQGYEIEPKSGRLDESCPSSRRPDREVVALCLDSLHRCPADDVADMLLGLRAATERYAVVAVSSLPSPGFNAEHRNILPRSSWLQLFQAAGFQPVRSLPRPADRRDDPLLAHWREVPPTVGRNAVEERFDLLEAVQDPAPALVRADVDEHLDLAFRRIKRKQWRVPKCTRFLFNLHHVQDYFFLRPLLDVIDPSQLIVLTRNGTFYPALQMETARAAVSRLGFKLIRYDRCDELPWRSFENSHLISASEGTIWYNQSLAHQIVAAARLSGCRTTLLQHGITLETFKNHFYWFGSDTILTWGDEMQHTLSDQRHLVLGRERPWGGLQPGCYRPMGSPKYADTLLPGGEQAIYHQLGVETGRFEDIVLVGAKSRRGYDADPSGFLARIEQTVRSRPERLFVVKTHPSNSAAVFLGLSAPNLLVLDEAHCIGADLSLARLIKGVDLVASSLSTLLLDGAVAGKDVMLYETEQKLGYHYVNAASLDGLDQRTVPGILAVDNREAFRKHYADAVDDRFYARFSAFCSEPQTAFGMAPDAALSLSLSSDVELLWAEREVERAEIDARKRSLESQQAVLDARVQDLDAQRVDFVAMQQRLEDNAENYRNECLRILSEWKKAVDEAARLRERLAALELAAARRSDE